MQEGYLKLSFLNPNGFLWIRHLNFGDMLQDNLESHKESVLLPGVLFCLCQSRP